MTIQRMVTLVALSALHTVAHTRAADCNNDGIDDSLQLGGCVVALEVGPVDMIPRLTIPDGNLYAGVGKPFPVLATFTICDVDVHVRIDHPWIGQLLIKLRHEDTGTEVVLVDRPGFPEFPSGYSISGIDITLDDDAEASIETAFIETIEGVFHPHPGTLADFEGESPEGNWTIQVLDVVPGDHGTLDRWGITFKEFDPRGNDCNLNDVPDDCETDTDGDSTPDNCDPCPNDRNKTDPGLCGCGVWDSDTDRDGTPDCNDLCPDDGTKTDPGGCGCGTPDADYDLDGTLDCNDGCACDENKTEPGLCGCGVPELVCTPPLSGDDTCDGGSNDGASCSVDGDCPGGVCGLKSRYITITPPVVAARGVSADLSIQVTIASMPLFPAREGEVWWAGPSDTVANPPNANLTGAPLVCETTPSHAEPWVSDDLHLFGEMILPGSSYEVRMCDAAGSICSDPLVVATGKWGDVVAPFGGGGQPAFSDIGPVVDKFRNVGSAPNMPRSDLVGPGNPGEPNSANQDVNFQDISADVDAFRGFGYPFTVPACP